MSRAETAKRSVGASDREWGRPLAHTRTLSRTGWLLVSICAVYVGLAVAYSTMIPAWESNDEMDHVAYVEYVRAHGSLPRIDGANGHQAHQPPLYYAVAAAWQELLRIRTFAPDPIWAALGQAVSLDRPTHELMLGHDYSPSQRAHAIDVHELRVLSILLGLATVVLTFLVGRAATGNAEVGLAAAAFVAVLPKLSVVMGTVTNDALVIPLSALALLLALRSVRVSSARARTIGVVALGAVLGAATLTKLNALPLAVVLLVAFPFLARGPLARRAIDVGLGLLAFLAVAGWWFVRNDRLYGDFLATKVSREYLNAWLPGLVEPVSWTDVDRFGYHVPEILLRSIWYDGGWNQFYAPILVNLVLALLAAAALAFAVRAFAFGRTVTGESLSRRAGLLLAVAPLAGLAAVLAIAKDYNQAEGRVTYVGLAAFATLAVLGAREALGPHRRLQIVGLAFWPACLALYNVFVLLEFVVPFRHL